MNTPTPSSAAGTLYARLKSASAALLLDWAEKESPIEYYVGLLDEAADALARAAQPPASADTAEMRRLADGLDTMPDPVEILKAADGLRTAADALDAADCQLCSYKGMVRDHDGWESRAIAAETALDAAREEIIKLTERCEAYQGQVKNGAIEIEALREEIRRLEADNRAVVRLAVKTKIGEKP